MTMDIEWLWYQGYSSSGEHPFSRRWCRLPWTQQWDLTIDLAIDFACGRAGYRRTIAVQLTGERHWYFPHPLSETGWWMVPTRIGDRIGDLVAAAGMTRCPAHNAVDVLRRWKQTGHWQRYATHTPRRTLRPPQLRWESYCDYDRWHKKQFSIKPSPKRGRGRPRKVAA